MPSPHRLESPISAPASRPDGVAPALDELETRPVSERRLVARGGASATVREDDHGYAIEVRDASARLIFELDLATGRAVVHAPGDLAIAAGGDVEIAARGAVRCRGREIDLQAGESAPSRLQLDHARVAIAGVAAEL